MTDGGRPRENEAYELAESLRAGLKKGKPEKEKPPIKIGGGWELGWAPRRPKEAPPVAEEPAREPTITPGRLTERIESAKREAAKHEAAKAALAAAEEAPPPPKPLSPGEELDLALLEGRMAKVAAKSVPEREELWKNLFAATYPSLKEAEGTPEYEKNLARFIVEGEVALQAGASLPRGGEEKAKGGAAIKATKGAEVASLGPDVTKLLFREAKERIESSGAGGGLTDEETALAIAREAANLRFEMEKEVAEELRLERARMISREGEGEATVPAAEKRRPEPLSQKFDTFKFSEILMGLSADTPIPPGFAGNLRVAVKANIAKVLWERTAGGQASFPGEVLAKPAGKKRDEAASAWVESIAEGQANDLTRGNPLKNAFRLYISVKEGLKEGLAKEGRDPGAEATRVAVYALTNVAKITAPGLFGSQPTAEGALGDPLDKIFENVAEAVLRRDNSHALQASEKLGRLFTQKQRELEATAVS